MKDPAARGDAERAKISDPKDSTEQPDHGESAPTVAHTANEPKPAKSTELPVVPGYQFLKLLGEGGMGTVYKARHLRLGRTVAVKIIHAARLADSAATRRFLREAKAAARLSHRHVIKVYDAGEFGGLHFLVMEYVEGIDLGRLVAKNGPLPVNSACDYLSQTALGLQHMYENGLVHRDIKPHNLFVASNAEDGLQADFGTVKILDMGLARFDTVSTASAEISELTIEGSLLGTPDYLAPEQALDARQADIRSDIYSLGCTLHFLLTGRPPFPGGTFAQKIASHLSVEPPMASSLRSDIPPELDMILTRMMAKQPEKRYQTPADLLAVLEQYKRGEAITADGQYEIGDPLEDENDNLAAAHARAAEDEAARERARMRTRARGKIKKGQRRRPPSKWWYIAAAAAGAAISALVFASLQPKFLICWLIVAAGFIFIALIGLVKRIIEYY